MTFVRSHRKPTARAIPQEEREAMTLRNQATAMRQRAANLRRSADADDRAIADRCDAEAQDFETRAAALMQRVIDREAEAAWHRGERAAPVFRPDRIDAGRAPPQTRRL